MKKPWSSKESKLLKENYSQMSNGRLQEILSERTLSSIQAKAHCLGLHKSNRALKLIKHTCLRKYSSKENYFSSINTTNSYWAGFIAADGCIVGEYCLVITLNKKDLPHLRKFKKQIGYSGPITFTHNEATLKISSLQIVQDLKKNFNITSRKSKTLEPPPLSNPSFIKSFIKGYMDGDGSLILRKGCLTLSIVSGSSKILDWIDINLSKLFLNDTFGSLHSEKNYYRYRLYGKRAMKVAKSLKTLPTPALTRKWKCIGGSYE